MRRQDFYDEVTTWDELISFCNDYALDTCEDIYDRDELDSVLTDEIKNYITNHWWKDLRDVLNDIPYDYEYYYREGDIKYRYVDDELNDFQDYVVEEMDRRGFWDEDEEELPAADTTPIEEEPLSIDELISASQAQILTISTESLKGNAPTEVDIEAFISAKATINGGN